MKLDVLTVGVASYDLVFSLPTHPGPNQKSVATHMIRCGGGPAANAAVTVARLGGVAAFAGYLGEDIEGASHMCELKSEGVVTELIVRGEAATPLSSVLVKPDGDRTVVNYREHHPIEIQQIEPSSVAPRVILFDGHEPALSSHLLSFAAAGDIPTVLDAGSLHPGTEYLAERVDYLVASEQFATDFAGVTDVHVAADHLGQVAANLVITLGGDGLIYSNEDGCGTLDAFPIEAVDSTGAGDTFHGAFALGIARKLAWPDLLRFASAAAAICCTRLGARPGIPTAAEVDDFLADHPQ